VDEPEAHGWGPVTGYVWAGVGAREKGRSMAPFSLAR
jgi:hypothetical protein